MIWALQIMSGGIPAAVLTFSFFGLIQISLDVCFFVLKHLLASPTQHFSSFSSKPNALTTLRSPWYPNSNFIGINILGLTHLKNPHVTTSTY